MFFFSLLWTFPGKAAQQMAFDTVEVRGLPVCTLQLYPHWMFCLLSSSLCFTRLLLCLLIHAVPLPGII